MEVLPLTMTVTLRRGMGQDASKISTFIPAHLHLQSHCSAITLLQRFVNLDKVDRDSNETT